MMVTHHTIFVIRIDVFFFCSYLNICMYVSRYRSKMTMLLFVVLLSLTSLCVSQSPTICDDPNFHTLENDQTKRLACGPAFENRCFCHMACYEGQYQHIVNCTNTGFTDTRPLEHLPNNTKVGAPIITIQSYLQLFMVLISAKSVLH